MRKKLRVAGYACVSTDEQKNMDIPYRHKLTK